MSAKKPPVDVEEQAKQNYLLGCSYLEEDNFDMAEKYFKKALDQQPKYIHAWNNLGVAYFNNRDYKAAEFCFQKALNINPTQKSALINLCYVYRDWKKWKKFLLNLKKFEQKFPEDSELISLYLQYYMGTQKYSTGVKFFDDILIDSNFSSLTKQTLFNILDLYEKAGQHKKAINILSKYLLIDEENKKDPEIWNNLGYYFEILGDYPQALEHYQRALALNKDDPLFWNNLGNVQAEMRELEKALDSYGKALDLAPNDPLIVNNYCDLALKMEIEIDWEHFIMILTEFSDTIEQPEDRLAVLDTLWKIHQRLNNSQDMERIRKKIMEIDPNYNIPE